MQFKAFVEIARHPKGVGIAALAEKLGTGRQNTRYYVKQLTKANIVKAVYRTINGRSTTLCTATPYGIHELREEVGRLHTFLDVVENDLIKKEG